ncbi:hypothetical protein [Spirosoma sp.]|uniref:hypothetical protein n=1 Tax=Spirosoma sp. TaxID=1899569 RepID=UPI00262FE3FA|nr:hypothetical protein [Spirosoma sp.]MCX6216553.1 hypothetical protein [Spirosoma sp.]
MQAESLHKQAALLSNSLPDFAEHDVEGRKNVIDAILELREAWKDAQHELETGQVRRPPLERDQKPTEARIGMSEAEIKLELQKNRVNISKNKKKIENAPEHRNRPTWEADLARLEAINNEYETELIRLKYETE